MNDKEKEINRLLLEHMPDTMYHGSIGRRYTYENFSELVKIFNSIDEYNEYEESLNLDKKEFFRPRTSFGRTNLDAAYHGFYLSPDRDSAYRWADKFKNGGQILVIKINKKKIIESGCISLCFPNEDWAKFTVSNRKISNTRNAVPASYTLKADGKMEYLYNIIQKINSDKEITNLLPVLVTDKLKIHMDETQKWNYNTFLADDNIVNGKYFQLCISSDELLKYLELIDIINIGKEG